MAILVLAIVCTTLLVLASPSSMPTNINCHVFLKKWCMCACCRSKCCWLFLPSLISISLWNEWRKNLDPCLRRNRSVLWNSQFGHANMKCCHRCQTSNRCVQIIAGLPDLCLILLVDRSQKPIPIVIFEARACLFAIVKIMWSQWNDWTGYNLLN